LAAWRPTAGEYVKFCFASGSGHPGGNNLSDEQEIRDLVSTWMSATQSGDYETVLTLMTDDALFLLPGRSPMTKEEFAAQAKKQTAQGLSIRGESNIQEISVSGDMASCVTALTVGVTNPAGERSSRSGHTLTIFRKIDGRWYLARDANLLAPGD
jgi:uncharacterized protein (TIGR02246 family)